MIDKAFAAWLRLMFSTLLLPVFIGVAGVLYLSSLNESLGFREVQVKAAEKLETMRLIAETEKYLCNEITAIFNRSADVKELESEMASFLTHHRLPKTFLIWNTSGDVAFSGIDHASIGGDLNKAWRDMAKITKNKFGNQEKGIPKEVIENLRQVFGPHFFPRYYRMCFSGRRLQLLRTDVSGKFPLTWLNITDKMGLLVHIDNEVVEQPRGLERFVATDEHLPVSAYIFEDQVVCGDVDLAETLRTEISHLRTSMKNYHEIAGYYVFKNFISKKITGLCIIEKNSLTSFRISWTMKMVLLMLSLMIIIFAVLSYRSIVSRVKAAIGIRKQLLILFLAANALPGFILAVFSSDYLQQFRTSLTNQAFNDSLSYMQGIDEHFASEYTSQKKRLFSAYPALIKKLKRNSINKRVIKQFLSRQSPSPYRMFLVASSTGIVAGSSGILQNGKVVEGFNRRFRQDTIRINTKEAVRKMCSYVMANFNRTPVTGKEGTEVEYIVDSLMQSRPEEMMRWYMQSGVFMEWGIGLKKHPTFIDHFKLFSPDKYDYLFTYMWDSEDLEIEFMRRVFHDLNRNEFGLQIMAVDERMNKAFPEEFMKRRRLREFALKLRDRTITQPEYCDLDGEKYILSGYKCIMMDTIRLLALYPVERIEGLVNDRQNLLIGLFFVSFLVSVLLSLFVASGILRPLAELQKGVQAIRERRFSWRLPDLGRDEFGRLAGMFNEMLVDLEELHVASTVQEKLMTHMEESLKTGYIEVFGRTVSLAEMGGDYFEVIETSAGEIGVLTGEVIGQSVGTCLMLSFIKSAVMQLEEFYSEPELLLTNLSELIARGSRSGHGDSVLLSYVLICPDGRVKISGNGLSAARLVNESGIRDLDEINKAAGADMSTCCFDLPADTALVCSTPGIFRNGFSDNMLLDQLVKRARSEEPKSFCDNLIAEFFTTLDKESCSNDMTVFIISNRKKDNGTKNS